MSESAYNSQFTESKLHPVTGVFCGIISNHLITIGSGGTALLTSNDPSGFVYMAVINLFSFCIIPTIKYILLCLNGSIP